MQVLETERLIFRHLTIDDLNALLILNADTNFMRFFGPPRSEEQVRGNINWTIEQYKTLGYGFYATLLKPDLRFIGRCGLLSQEITGTLEVEVAYGLAPKCWGQGLATEAARALKAYAFETLDISRVISIVDIENFASQRVAEKNGMSIEKVIDWHGHKCFLYAARKWEHGRA